jgi:Holliday junction DNA helicase RuvB
MEDFALDIIIGKGPSAKTLRLDLARFTLIGTTIQIGAIAAPMRERFGSVHKLDFYKIRDIKKMVIRSAKILGVEIENDAAWEIARSSRRTPRVANRLLKRIRDFAQVKTDGKITFSSVKKALKMLDIDHLGLDLADRNLLKTIIQKFGGGPVGLDTIAACIGEDRGNIEEVYEPYLMRLGFIKRTPRGRVAQPKAYEYLGFPYLGDDGTKKVNITQINKNQEKLL